MKVFDGLMLRVQFYANNGALKQVSVKSGVPITRLEQWLEGGELSAEDRELLEQAAKQ
jgi:hypothetical protein